MRHRDKYKTSGLTSCPAVAAIGQAEANALLRRYHYLGAVRTASLWLGHDEGCTVWGVMRSRTWHQRLVAAGFNPIELIRMVGIDGHAWATSSMLAKSAKVLIAETTHDVLVTYADPMQSHTGAVYLAANWKRLPQDAQPDGYVWRLDGRVVSRKRFFAELGTSAIDRVRDVYGSSITLELDAPKRRFYWLKDNKRITDFLEASKKVKTWGKARSVSLGFSS